MWCCGVSPLPTLHRPTTHGPGEAEGEADGVAEGRISAARAVGDAEGVGPQDGGDGTAVGAGRLGGHAGLVVLEADAEEGLAVALLQPTSSGAAPPAAVTVAEQPLLIDKLLQLQLEDPGATNLGGVGRRQSPSAPPGITATDNSPLPASPGSGGPRPPAGPPGGGKGGVPPPTPRALTWQRLSSAERRASASRNRAPILEGQRRSPRFPPPFLLLGGEKVSRGNGEGVGGETQRAKPPAPAELEEFVSRFPAFRSVSGFFFFPLRRYLSVQAAGG